MEEYTYKLDSELDLMEHFIISTIVIIKYENIKNLLEKEDLRRRQGYPYYVGEYPDKDKEKIALFQRNPEMFLQKQ